MIHLRPYQLAAIDAVRAQLRKAPDGPGRTRPILCIPTGGGKTLTAAHILIAAVEKGKRVMFVAHRKEIIDQTVRAFAKLGVTDVGVIRAKDRRTNASAAIQVASIDTLRGRQPVEGLDLIVIDECHRACAKTYVTALFMAYPGARFLGLTATPCRADGKPLGHVFDALVLGSRYSELIASGHIVEPIVFSTPTAADLSQVRTTGGDYNLDDLEAAVNKGALIGNLIGEWRKHAYDRVTVVFAVSVAHSKAIVDRFTEEGIVAEHIDGTTPEFQRAQILRRLEDGPTRVVVNVGVLTEGWDCPPCKCIVLARPTKSLALYMQMSGRGLRPWNNVTPIVLDHAGNVDRHGLPHEDREWSLETKPKRGSQIAPLKVCKGCFAYIAAGCKSCPHCGLAMAVDAQKKLPEADVIDVALAVRTREQMVRETKLPEWAEQLSGDDRTVKTFQALLRKKIALGYKPGYVAHAFEAVTKRPLPREWAQRLRA